MTARVASGACGWIAAWLTLFAASNAVAQSGPISAHRPRQASLATGAAYRLEARYHEYLGVGETSCSPSRAAALARRLNASGSSPAVKLAMRNEIRAMQLTRQEAREVHNFRLIAAKYEKSQQQRAQRDARQMRPIDRPADPFLAQMASERTERKRRTGNADPP